MFVDKKKKKKKKKNNRLVDFTYYVYLINLFIYSRNKEINKGIKFFHLHLLQKH